MESIGDARAEIGDVLEENPSLKPMALTLPAEVYDQALKRAVRETGIARKSFPPTCPYSFEQIMDDDFLPE